MIGCGGSGAVSQSTAVGLGPALDAPLRLADCTDWNAGTEEERAGTIAQVKNYIGGPIGTDEGTGAVLTDQQAYDLFENYCANDFARAFKLYKLYARAAAFTPQQ